MMTAIDAYDVLGIPLDATEEDVKKAYKKKSLSHHPDKLGANANSKETKIASDKFNQIKAAYDTLQDPERRKIYDTFGIDLGEERPEIGIFNIGVENLLSPLGTFTFHALIAKSVFWFLSWTWVSYLVLMLALGIVLGFFGKVKVICTLLENGLKLNREDPSTNAIVVVYCGLPLGSVFLSWVWPMLLDVVVIWLLLASNFVGFPTAVSNLTILGVLLLCALVLGRLLMDRWIWVFTVLIVLMALLLLSLTIGCGVVRLYIENVKVQHGEKLKESRQRLRETRQKKDEEIERLKKRLGVAER